MRPYSFFYLGYDTTSAFDGKGMAKALETAREKEEYVQYFTSLGASLPPSARIKEGLSKFVCHLYGHTEESDLNRLRYEMF